MDAALAAAAHGPAVLVTVAAVEGSGPREAGAHMLVAALVHGTIGGGHLELRAIDIARAMLADGRQRHIERFALGPSLGQCCGGVVHLAFEAADAVQAALLAERQGQDSWRLVALDGAPEAALCDEQGRALAGAAPLFARGRGTHVMQEQDGRRWLVDAVRAPRAHLLLFGAGHVGAAIVRALAELPCTVTWVDEREDMFPQQVPANTVAEAIMARDDVGWFGLIGSHTKRKQFEHRLRARGVDEARIAAMVCPVGIAGVTNKAPAVIAASVAAQLLGAWEAAEKAELQPCAKLVAMK